MTAVRGFAAYYAALRYFIIDRHYFRCGERRAIFARRSPHVFYDIICGKRFVKNFLVFLF